MEDDGVVGVVVMMTVAPPVAGADVKLHVACPDESTDLDHGVEDVGSGVCVGQSGAEHLDRLACRGGELRGEVASEPQVVHQPFALWRFGGERDHVVRQPGVGCWVGVVCQMQRYTFLIDCRFLMSHFF